MELIFTEISKLDIDIKENLSENCLAILKVKYQDYWIEITNQMQGTFFVNDGNGGVYTNDIEYAKFILNEFIKNYED